MPRSQITALATFAAITLSLTLGGCGNSSTTYACDGSSSCHAGLTSQPAEGELVKLYLGDTGGALYGTVKAVDEESIELETEPAGKLVASWGRVIAWEAGDSVREELVLRESAKRYSAETNRMIRETSSILPGAKRD